MECMDFNCMSTATRIYSVVLLICSISQWSLIHFSRKSITVTYSIEFVG